MAERVHVQRGLYYEEFEDDAVYQHTPGRTATEADNVLFTTLTMNPQALHLDHVAAASTDFGRPLINSMWTLSTLVGLSVAQLTQSTLVAQLGLDDVSFPAPLFAGDTLIARTRVVERRLSRSRPGQGIVVFEHTGLNQDGVVVARARRTALMLRSPGS